jgi:glutathione synthase/RimK-type ligase-like ATP-grasp enzyme
MRTIIFSIPGDYHTEAVRWALRQKGAPCEVIYATNLAQKTGLNATFGPKGCEIDIDSVHISLNEKSNIGSVWYRRSGGTVLENSIHPADVAHSRYSWVQAVNGIQLALCNTSPLLVNSPERYFICENKVFQLYNAQKIGFAIPRTLVSNDKQQIIKFIEDLASSGSRAICKPFNPHSWHTSDGRTEAFGTSLVTVEDVMRSDVRSSPNIYQEYVEKPYEVRLCAIGDNLFAAKVDSQQFDEAAIDFRKIADTNRLGCQSIDIPMPIRTMCVKMLRSFGLSHGSFDFVVDSFGNWIFLELNEMGNFLWLEGANQKLPLLDCFSEFLISGDRNFHYVERQGRLRYFDFRKEDAEHGIEASRVFRRLLYVRRSYNEQHKEQVFS